MKLSLNNLNDSYKGNVMHIKIGGYYLVKRNGVRLIVKVHERRKGYESKWKCSVYNGGNVFVDIRRGLFKERLGDSKEQALKEFAEYFI